jgi:diguanylate cyclase (GGDEF)-like protein
VLGYSLIVGDHPPPISIIVMMTLAVTSFSAMFPARGIAFGVGVTSIFMLVGALAFNNQMVLHDPTGLIYGYVALGVVALVGRSIGASASDHRGAAVVDQLTGMLNRVALEARVAELAHQAATTGGQVAMIVADLDHFKAVNDEHGHSVGDAVLRDVAYRLRSDLRSFESAYRIGGEEFVILLAGTDAPTAGLVAERLRVSVQNTPAAGVDVTMSFGVAATAPGESFEYTDVFERADMVLYEAKNNGRDRVIVDGMAPERELVAA